MDPQVIEALNAEGASMAGFLPNESVSVKDVLYGVILPSGADATTLTSNYISGSEAAFAEEMNRYAEKLGMKDTHFLNASGLHQEGHYSTVDDLRILLTEALKNKDFYDVFTTLIIKENLVLYWALGTQCKVQFLNLTYLLIME